MKKKYLGIFIGSVKYKDEYMNDKTENWVPEIGFELHTAIL